MSFDHNAPVTEGGAPGRRFLIQNGIKYTYAEYNRFEKKFEPEPKPVNLVQEARVELIPVFKEFIKKLDDLKESLEPMLDDIKTVIVDEVAEEVDPISIDEFIRLSKDEFRVWVAENIERIAVLEDEVIRDSMIKKWERFYPEEDNPIEE
jgi:hypothetical protein